jgi:uncharacterized protein YraI
VDTNCRQGDSTSYSVVTSFSAGQSFQIDGRNAATTWFWILMPQGGHCWMAASSGTPSGPYQTAPIIALPTATPTAGQSQPPPSAPNAPSSLQANQTMCSANGYQVTLTWKDNSDNESGFRVFRDGQLIATLGANSNQYVDSPPDFGQQSYYVEAYNQAGAAKSNTASEDGCVY